MRAVLQKTTDASQQNNTGPLGGPVITDVQSTANNNDNHFMVITQVSHGDVKSWC